MNLARLLKRHGLSLTDIDLFEINEAFAAQTIFCMRQLEIDEQRVNVNGGAISLGHPYGMTGCRLVGQLLRDLKRKGGRLGVVSICVGGGLGVAALWKRVDSEVLSRLSGRAHAQEGK